MLILHCAIWGNIQLKGCQYWPEPARHNDSTCTVHALAIYTKTTTVGLYSIPIRC